MDLNFSYLTNNALDQDVISVDHVERSAEDPVCLGTVSDYSEFVHVWG